MLTTLDIGKTYRFSVYAPELLGNDLQNVAVLAILDRETANMYLDTVAWHQNIYPQLPAGTPNDPNSYQWALFRTSTGQKICLGLAWIKEETVQLIEARTITAKIGDVGQVDLERIRNLLIAANYNNISVTIA